MADQPSPVIYAITPETPFSLATPSGSSRSSRIYKVGTILEKKESRHVEYKSAGGVSYLEAHVRRYGSAFLNSSGGVLCIGVNDDGRVVGIGLPKYSQRENIRKTIRQEFEKFTPPVQQDLYEINFIPCNKKEFYVLEVAVRAGDPYEIYSDGADKMYYKRDGSVEGPLWPNKIREIVSAKYRKKLENQRSLQSTQ